MSGIISKRLVKLSQCSALIALSACSQASDDSAEESRVQVRYTEYGIAHVRAADYRSLGFGQGYAQAKDNLCMIEEGMLGFDGKLSRYFGPDAPASSMLLSTPNSLLSDLYFRGIAESHIVEDLVAKAGPLGPRDEVRELVRGYVAGFNRYLVEDPEVSCRGEAWIRPMTELDVYRRVYAVTTFMNQGAYFAGGIATAEPPNNTEARFGASSAEALAQLSEQGVPRSRPGSNGVALGGDVTRSGGGINLANPHLSWAMDMRWSVGQLTIPGELNVSGAALIGVPLIVMGHTDSAAWSITTAEKTRHFTLYELTLADDSPTRYLVDGKEEAMVPRQVSIEVKQPDGSLETVTHTEWWTRFGPVLGDGSAVPLPPWSAGSDAGPGHAYALADANRTNMRMLNTLFAFNHAESVHDVLDGLRENQGAPWWTVLAADAGGDALFSQLQAVPNVDDQELERCSTELGKAYWAGDRFPVLDGSRSDCAWQSAPHTVEAGIMAPERMPAVLTRDYAENSNDSHWLISQSARIEGMPGMLGDELTERSLRTRGLNAEIEEQKARAPYTGEMLAKAMLSNRSYTADLVLGDVLEICRGLADGRAQASSGETIDIRPACEVLGSWDHAMNVDSAGALFFQSFWLRAEAAAAAEEVSLWMVPFDPADPIHTPRTLDPESPLIVQALADTVQELASAGQPMGVALGDFQYVERNGRRIPIGGGLDSLGVMNLIDPSVGFTNHDRFGNGSTYMHVVSFDGSACPDALTLLSYSQSTEPSSPHYADQTELYSRSAWVTERFCESAIAASPELKVIELQPTDG